MISAMASGPLFLGGLGVCWWLGVPGSLFLAGLGADYMVRRLVISTSPARLFFSCAGSGLFGWVPLGSLFLVGLGVHCWLGRV